MADREQMAIDLLCGKLQTSWSYCDPSCISCKFYHEESDMGARVSICVHGFGSSKESCGFYTTQREYLEFVRSGFADLKAENVKLRERVTELEELTDGKRYIPQEWYKQLQAENARMHEYVTKLEQANIALDSDNTELRNDMKDMQMIVSDNHKLRELVKEMRVCLEDECKRCHEWGDTCDLERQMRELGVEV